MCYAKINLNLNGTCICRMYIKLYELLVMLSVIYAWLIHENSEHSLLLVFLWGEWQTAINIVFSL